MFDDENVSFDARLVLYINSTNIPPIMIKEYIIFIYYYRYSALEPVWAETRAQSVDWCSSGTLHPGQVLKCRLPLLSPSFF